MTAEQILDLADTDAYTIARESHETGHRHLVVQVEDGEIVDALVVDTNDGYYRASNDDWHHVYHWGTGSCPCNCDACADGGDPWTEYDIECDEIQAILDAIADAVTDMTR